jgi:hypothetical protein
MFYKDRQLTTKYKPDLVVCGGIVVELKAVVQLLPEHDAQLFNYIHAHRPDTCRVSGELWPQRRSRVEEVHPEGSAPGGDGRQAA